MLLLMIFSINVSAINIDESMTGSWFDENNTGQGINIEVLTNNRLLIYWYTYKNGQPFWLTGVGDIQEDSVEIELSQFDGGRFGVNHESNLVSSTVFGSLSISFDSCNTGIITYNSIQEFGSGSINLNRLTSIPGIPCTTPTTPFNQNIVDSNGLRFQPGTCSLLGNLLTCEFSITSLDNDTQGRLFSGGGITDNGISYRVKSTKFGSGIFATDQTLTKGIPVNGTITFDEIPSSKRMIDLLKIRFRKEDTLFDVDFFDVVIVNQN